MDLLYSRLKGTTSEESKQYGMSFNPRENDCFVATFAKCGTTWVTFICHCLRSRGDLNFDDINQVVPWNETALILGQNLDDDHAFSPRVFKTHDTYEEIPKGAKIICVTRDPRTVLMSYYEFLLAVAQVDQSLISVDTFFDCHFAKPGKRGLIWDFFLGYYNEREALGEKMLWICYEDLLCDLEKCIEKIAGVSLDDDLRVVVLEQASFKFMKEHHELFNEHLLLETCRENMGLPEGTKMTADKVNKGSNVSRSALNPRIEERMNELWAEKFAAATGVENYEALRCAMSLQYLSS